MDIVFDDVKVQLMRSRRKTLSAQIIDGKLVVKAPLEATKEEVSDFLERHRRWIENHLERARLQQEKANLAGALSLQEIRELANQALQVIPERVRHYASRMGVTYGRITIRNQTSRWGSCSSKGNLNFNCLLMLCPPEVLDAVVVHELAHRREMNHSPRFYAEVLRMLPDYWKWDAWLKEHGPILMKRMTDGR